MRQNKICEMLGIEFPLIAFSHCRDVVVSVSKAGGMGVFGAVNHPPDLLKEELDWICDHIDGKPFGLDLIVPEKMAGAGASFSPENVLNSIPENHIEFINEILNDHDISAPDLDDDRRNAADFSKNLHQDGAQSSLDIAFQYPISLIVNALGVPPQFLREKAKAHGVLTGALIGSARHAIRQIEADIDILIAAGGEAGGHCGEVSTMVLIPEVARALRAINVDTPILAAGGIATGEQMAAAMAMGASGVWCGSVWLTTTEAETNPVVKAKMLEAGSRDTIRSRSRTGKPSRQLRSAWTDAWEKDSAPNPLPMPFQSIVSEPPLRHIDKLSQSDHAGAKDLATYWVGQAVGLMNDTQSCGQVVQQFKTEFLEAIERVGSLLPEN